MPFSYADSVTAERRPNSLLAMPAHSLPYVERDWDERRYAQQIAELNANVFDHARAKLFRRSIKQRIVNW